MAQLWGGRFTKETDQLVYKFNASISFDQRFYEQDIKGSMAHVTMLAKQGILTDAEKETIITGLQGILDDVKSGKLEITDKYEDIHSFVEANLIDRVGARQEAKVDLERKLEAVMKWIDYLSFLKTYDATFGPGFKFRPADIEVQISCQIELKDKASKLFQDKKKYNEVVEKLVSELEKAGTIELENEHDNTYKVLTAFHYMEDLVDCITISEEMNDEIF